MSNFRYSRLTRRPATQRTRVIRTVIAGVVLAWPIAALSGPPNDLAKREVYLSALDVRAQAAAVKALERLQEGSIRSGLTQLQDLLDDTTLENRLLRPRRLDHPDQYRVNVPARRELRRVVLSLPRQILDQYRLRFDASATALRSRALVNRDPWKLLECFQRYPASTVGARCALDAADVFAARGHTSRARKIWDELRLFLDERQIDETKPSKSPAELWPGLRAALKNRALRFSERKSSPSRSTLPRVPLTPGSVELAWERDTRAGGDGDGYVAYSVVPSIFGRRIATPMFNGIQVLDVERGGDLGYSGHYPHDWDPGIVNKPRSTENGSEYTEVSENLHLTPLSFDDGTHLASYVSWMNEQKGWRGRGMQEVSIPRRSLTLRRWWGQKEELNGVVIWDTHRHPDPRVRPLSFNSQPTVVGDEVLALGWLWSGYTDVYLCCFDRRTGQLRFRTLIVSNQIELTRFGFMACEPFLGGVAVDDDSVYVSTNMGAVASVHLGSGRLEWLTEYFPVRPARSMSWRRRRMPFPYEPPLYWDHSRPAVVDGHVVFAPQDSYQLLTCQRSSGEVTNGRKFFEHESNRLLGQWNDLIIHVRDDVKLLATDPNTPGSHRFEHRLFSRCIGKPVLCRRGVLYATANGLRLALLDPTQGFLGELDLAPTNGEWNHDRDRNVTIQLLEQEVLISTPYRVCCYRTGAQ